MTRQREPDHADTTYRYLHLSLEELAQLPPDELLQACVSDKYRHLCLLLWLRRYPLLFSFIYFTSRT